MFGMGFSEILIIIVIAILFLGPDKLPTAMVDIAKFFRDMKRTVSDVKNTIEEEIHVSEIKQEALAYKEELLQASDKVSQTRAEFASLDTHVEDLLDDTKSVSQTKEQSIQQERVTFKKEENN